MSVARPALWIVDPSLVTPEDRGVAEILQGWPGAHRLFRPSLSEGDEPDAGDYAADGVVVMGSAASVHDSLPWMARLGAWLTPILSGEFQIPLLGICFGHQLVAHLAGGTVEFLDPARTKRIGVETTRLTDGRLLPGTRELRVVVSHREHVRTAPPDYRVVATRSSSPIDGLEHVERPVYSFQFHPEAREDFAERAGFDPARIDGRVRGDSRSVLAAFRRHVLEQARRPR